MSLRLRVVVAIALVLFASSAVGIALAGWQARQVLVEELTAAMTGGRQTIESAFEDLPRSDHPARDLRQLVATFDGNRHVIASLYDRTGHRLATSIKTTVTPAPKPFAALFHPPIDSLHLAVPVAGYGVLALEPVYADDVSATWAEFVDLSLVLTASFFAGSALIWFTVGRALRPLSEFSAAFLRIGSGDYDAKVREHGPSELVRLGRGVNEMSERLAAMQVRNQALESQLRTLQDEERADLARDLHDEIGPHLFAVNVDAAMAQRLIGEGKGQQALERVESIQSAVRHMQQLVRDILGRLRPTELIELGLAAAIAELIAFWRVRHPQIHFEVRLPADDGPLEAVARETLYRVVQEGLNNAVRHGRPDRISIDIVFEERYAAVTISDDGARATAPAAAGFGLAGMRERVAAARGELTIERGGPGTGWTLTARLPIEATTDNLAAARSA